MCCRAFLQIIAWVLRGEELLFVMLLVQANSTPLRQRAGLSTMLFSREEPLGRVVPVMKWGVSCLCIAAFHPLPNCKSDGVWTGRLARGWYRKVLTLKNLAVFPPSVSVGGVKFKVMCERRIYLGANSEHSGSCLDLCICLCVLLKRQVL